MTSPLPGMDPYLEQPAFWSSFHSRVMVALADAIEANLSADYYVEVEARTYLDDSAGGVLIGIPDVVVAAPSAVDQLPTAMCGPVAVHVKPQPVEVPVPEAITERYLEIREVATGAVITAIELLSPKNKRAGSGRTSYVEKRAQVLGSATHLVEFDLLRADAVMPVLGTVEPTPYRILVSPSDRRLQADLYGFGLQQPLPDIVLPLKPGDPPITIALQPIFDGVYDRGRYHARIDYTQPPPSLALAEADQRWLAEHLQRQGDA
ncbi:MAG: DUF4058 family protein [Cyanobacteria bacterium P01_H01_bin.162]